MPCPCLPLGVPIFSVNFTWGVCITILVTRGAVSHHSSPRSTSWCHISFNNARTVTAKVFDQRRHRVTTDGSGRGSTFASRTFLSIQAITSVTDFGTPDKVGAIDFCGIEWLTYTFTTAQSYTDNNIHTIYTRVYQGTYIHADITF